MARVASPPTNLLDRMGKGTPLPGTDQKIRFMNEMTIGRGVAGGQAEAAGLGRSHAKWCSRRCQSYASATGLKKNDR